MSIDGLTKIIEDEFRVIADVERDAYLAKDDPKVLARRSKALEAEIKRHCDGYQNLYWTRRVREVCVFCDEEWKGCVDDNGYPCCCEKAQKKADDLGIKEASPSARDRLHAAAPDLLEACTMVLDHFIIDREGTDPIRDRLRSVLVMAICKAEGK
ncbi:hypothetical protein LCGC14_2120840 [marine sediment metagenome]|uniref:Uncharacterized protein n=1 Tax=marine sediment metagenome TaxID=412755 RepID=A0A0F9H0L9_9ZZZZ